MAMIVVIERLGLSTLMAVVMIVKMIARESVDTDANGRRANTVVISVRNRKGTEERGSINTDGGRREATAMIDHILMTLIVVLLFHRARKEGTDEGRMKERVVRKEVGGLDLGLGLGLGLVILLGLDNLFFDVTVFSYVYKEI